MKVIATQKSEQNRAAVDPWTVVHLSSGLALGLIEVSLGKAFSASVAYECAEQLFERYEWGKQFFEVHGPESLPNAIVDSAAFLIGHRLGRMWNES